MHITIVFQRIYKNYLTIIWINMKKLEYKIYQPRHTGFLKIETVVDMNKVENELSELGKEGWELIDIARTGSKTSPLMYFFKKEIN